MSAANQKLNWFFEKDSPWKEAYVELRAILLDSELTEELKWGWPCYALNGKNVVLMHGFKEYCALLFHKGVLLKDDRGLLIQQTENVQVARQIRFRSAGEIVKLKRVLKAYVGQAIEIEKSGVKVKLKKTAEFKMVPEFAKRLRASSALKKAFESLTPGRQRGYLLYFSSAKRSETREARIENNIENIMAGKGLD